MYWPSTAPIAKYDNPFWKHAKQNLTPYTSWYFKEICKALKDKDWMKWKSPTNALWKFKAYQTLTPQEQKEFWELINKACKSWTVQNPRLKTLLIQMTRWCIKLRLWDRINKLSKLKRQKLIHLTLEIRNRNPKKVTVEDTELIWLITDVILMNQSLTNYTYESIKMEVISLVQNGIGVNERHEWALQLQEWTPEHNLYKLKESIEDFIWDIIKNNWW